MQFAKNLLFGCTLILLVSATMHAQPAANSSAPAVVPQLVSFSGKAINDQGKPVVGIAGITVSIYKDQYDGAPLWMETQNVNADVKGNYTVQLGATSAEGLPLDLFTSGEARWLGVRVNGGEEQPRVLLLSVPYALKAADAQTLGGLPASAFVLAAPPSTSAFSGSEASGSLATEAATGTKPVTTAGGTVNTLAKFDANADVTNSLIFDNGTNVGIGNTAPAAKLDVSGTGIFRGLLTLPAIGAATATAGKTSQPMNFTASAFNSSTAKALNQTFRWQAEPTGNNSSNPSGSLNLLFGANGAAPKETGLSISNKGILTFAPGQTFPSASGTVTSVALSAPSSDFIVSGSPVTSSGTLGLNWKVAPTNTNVPNAIVKRDAEGNISAGSITANSTNSLGVTANGSPTGVYGSGTDYGVAGSGPIAVYGEGVQIGVSGSATTYYGVYGDGPTGVYGYGTNTGLNGVATGSSGIGVNGSSPGWAFHSAGNAQQDRTFGGWVKAMVYFSGLNGGRVAYCFNSTLAGAAATAPPCGITFSIVGTGDYVIDFGFEVDDRFFSITPSYLVGTYKICTASNGGGCVTSITANQVELLFFNSTGSAFTDNKFYLVVY